MLPRQALVQAHVLVSALLVAGALLLRYAVSFWPHSGRGVAPMFGDFEAQRHWMEVTVNLPLNTWYVPTQDNDLLYWGLDYPPLTAYVSWVFGALARIALPDLVQLHSSRGIEVEAAKVFMRLTVLLCDAFVFIPAAFAWARLCFPEASTPTESASATTSAVTSRTSSATACPTATVSDASRPHFQTPLSDLLSSPRVHALLLVLVCPPLLLIDHGHFQYNSVALGFVMWASVLALKGRFFWGGVAFACAVNFKHTSLYFAAGFGSWLLRSGWDQSPSGLSFRLLLPALSFGCAFFLATFALWLPFCALASESCTSGVVAVAVRLFPVSRGLFEDKVANVWCVLEPVLRLKATLPQTSLVALATLATLLGLLPGIVAVLRRKATSESLCWGLFVSALTFFLASYQVHEKAILLPLLPLLMLGMQHPKNLSAFTFAAMFSMYPLILKDGLAIPYFLAQCVGVGFGVRVWGWISLFSVYVLLCACLHASWVCIPPPVHLPHLHPLLNAVVSCFAFAFALCVGMAQLTKPSHPMQKPKAD